MFLLGGQVLLPDLLSLDLLVIHLLHLTLQLAPTVLYVENLATLESLLIAVQHVDYEDADRKPDYKYSDYDGLETYMIDNGQAVLLVHFFVVQLLLNIAMCHFFPDHNVPARAILCALPECIDVKERT